MIVQCNLVRLFISPRLFAILCCPLLFFGFVQLSYGLSRNGPFPDFDWGNTQDVLDDRTGQFGHNLERLLALVNVTAAPFALTPPFLVQTLKADERAAGMQRANGNEYGPLNWRSVHVTERGKDVVLTCGLPCSRGREYNAVNWSYKLNASDDEWGIVPNEYPRFFTVKFKDCEGLSVLVIHHVSDKEGGAMFRCHYRRANAAIEDDRNDETLIESVVELVLLDGSSDGDELVNATSELSGALSSDGSANFNETDNGHENRTLLFADFQQPSANDIPKLLKLLNVTKSIALDGFDPVETRNDFTGRLDESPSNTSGHPKMGVMRHSFNQHDRLLLQCANLSLDYHPDVHWFVANETVDFLERYVQSTDAEYNWNQLNWTLFEDNFPERFLITLKNSGGNRLLVLLENKAPAIYKCSYNNRIGHTHEKLVHLTSQRTANEGMTSYVLTKNASPLSVTNETAVTSRNGERVLINMLSWFQNTLDFYVELLRIKATQSKQQNSNGVSKNNSSGGAHNSRRSFLEIEKNNRKSPPAILSRQSN